MEGGKVGRRRGKRGRHPAIVYVSGTGSRTLTRLLTYHRGESPAGRRGSLAGRKGGRGLAQQKVYCLYVYSWGAGVPRPTCRLSELWRDESMSGGGGCLSLELCRLPTGAVGMGRGLCDICRHSVGQGVWVTEC